MPPVSTREIGLGIGDRIGDFEVVSVIPRAFRPGIWAVAGQRDRTYATWTASRQALDAVPVAVDNIRYFTDVADALADMLRRARK